ncbi:MAG TPA: TonB-dependent receptor [Puia sp.]|nr:TonB-dependent receptor [Puia sp.]
MNTKKWVIFMLLAGGRTAFAQQSPDSTKKQLDEVVVTATRYPVKQSLTGKVLNVITREQLDRNEGRQLTDILNEQTGIVIIGAQNAPGSEQDVLMQGAPTGATLILIDGIPAYDPSGTTTNFDLNLINTDEIERVEVLKGSQSTLYGSDATAGVINIITKKGSGKPLNASFSASAGSWHTFKGSAGLDGKTGQTAYDLRYTKYRSNGFSDAYDSTGRANFDRDGFNEDMVTANVSHSLSRALRLSGNFQYSRYDHALDAGAYTDDPNYTTSTGNVQAGIGAEYELGAAMIHFNYHYNTVTRNYLDDSAIAIAQGGSFSQSSYTGRSHYLELYSNISLSRHADLLAGLDYRNQRISESDVYLSQYYSSVGALGIDSSKVRQGAGYVSLLLKEIGGFNFGVGGRYNSFSRYGKVITYSIDPSFLINDRLKLFANLSSGFSAPTLYQLYSPYRDPYGSLKPERTESVETGVQYSRHSFNARAVFFQRRTTDEVVFTFDAANPQGFYVNQDRQNDVGAEVEAAGQAGHWTFSANYTYTTGKGTTITNGKDTSFYNLYRQPKHLLNLKLGWQATTRLFVSASLRSVGKRIESVYGGSPIGVPAYYTLNGYADYRLTRRWKCFVDLENLTDRQYFDIPGFNSKRFNFMAGGTLHL